MTPEAKLRGTVTVPNKVFHPLPSKNRFPTADVEELVYAATNVLYEPVTRRASTENEYIDPGQICTACMVEAVVTSDVPGLLSWKTRVPSVASEMSCTPMKPGRMLPRPTIQSPL